MKKAINSYHCSRKVVIRVILIYFLGIVASPVFSQEESTDTVVTVTDSLSQLNEDDEYGDSVAKSEYDYYDHLVYWPSDSFVMRQVPDSIITALKNQDAFWYADKDFKKKITDPPKRNKWDKIILQPWFNTLLWTIIIGGFAIVLIWFLIDSNVRLFTKRAKQIQGDDQLSENIFEINYNGEIDKAIQNGNYRLAVRLMFLRLLKNLAEINAIQYKEDATNFDYLVQLKGSPWYNSFFKVTRYYEYAWYGAFDVSEELYKTIKKDFESINNQVTRN